MQLSPFDISTTKFTKRKKNDVGLKLETEPVK